MTKGIAYRRQNTLKYALKTLHHLTTLSFLFRRFVAILPVYKYGSISLYLSFYPYIQFVSVNKGL
jgi:hypothetical protein